MICLRYLRCHTYVPSLSCNRWCLLIKYVVYSKRSTQKDKPSTLGICIQYHSNKIRSTLQYLSCSIQYYSNKICNTPQYLACSTLYY